MGFSLCLKSLRAWAIRRIKDKYVGLVYKTLPLQSGTPEKSAYQRTLLLATTDW